MKSCLRCKETKELSEYGKDSSTKDQLTRWCKLCRKDGSAEAQKKYRAANPDKYTSVHMRKWHLKHAYGLTIDQFDKLLDSQNGVCATCKFAKVNESFHVDHDHSCCPGTKSCGRCVRGILCRNCNVALGLLKDNTETIERMLIYLKKFGIK